MGKSLTELETPRTTGVSIGYYARIGCAADASNNFKLTFDSVVLLICWLIAASLRIALVLLVCKKLTVYKLGWLTNK